MIPWIQVYSNLPRHPKTTRLADELKLSSAVVDPDTVAVGMLIGLWTWAIQNAYDGDLSRVSNRAIAGACSWKKSPDALVKALQAAGWIDDDRRLHDWEEYALLLIDAEDNRKENDCRRAKKYRDKKRDEAADVTLSSRDGHVTERDESRSYNTIPYHTIPYHTIPYQSDISISSERKKEPDDVENMTQAQKQALYDLETAQRLMERGFTVEAGNFGTSARAAGAIFDSNFRFIAWKEDA